MASKVLYGKYEDLSLVPRTTYTVADAASQACRPSTAMADIGRLWDLLASQSSQTVEPQARNAVSVS